MSKNQLHNDIMAELKRRNMSVTGSEEDVASDDAKFCFELSALGEICITGRKSTDKALDEIEDMMHDVFGLLAYSRGNKSLMYERVCEHGKEKERVRVEVI